MGLHWYELTRTLLQQGSLLGRFIAVHRPPMRSEVSYARSLFLIYKSDGGGVQSEGLNNSWKMTVGAFDEMPVSSAWAV